MYVPFYNCNRSLVNYFRLRIWCWEQRERIDNVNLDFFNKVHALSFQGDTGTKGEPGKFGPPGPKVISHF